MTEYLLDTNHVTHLLNRNPTFQQRLENAA